MKIKWNKIAGAEDSVCKGERKHTVGLVFRYL